MSLSDSELSTPAKLKEKGASTPPFILGGQTIHSPGQSSRVQVNVAHQMPHSVSIPQFNKFGMDSFYRFEHAIVQTNNLRAISNVAALTAADRNRYIDELVLNTIETRLLASGAPDVDTFLTWEHERFFLHVRNMFTKANNSSSFDVESFQKLFKELKLEFDPKVGIESADSYLSDIYRICKSMGEAGVDFEDPQLQATIAHMYEAFPKGKFYEHLRLNLEARGKFTTIIDFRKAITVRLGEIITILQKVEDMGLSINKTIYHSSGSSSTVGSSSKSYSGNKRSAGDAFPHGEGSRAGKSSVTSITRRCNACGMAGHERDTCNFVKKSHPDVNLSGLWSESASGKSWKALGYDNIQWTMKSIGTSPSPYIPVPSTKKVFTKAVGKNPSEYVLALHDKRHAATAINAEFDMTNILIPSLISVNQQSKALGSFFDTGALSGNYISAEMAAWLVEKGVKLCQCRKLICSPVGGCTSATGILAFTVTLINEISFIKTIIDLSARILNSEYDLIIGLPTLRQYALLKEFDYKFTTTSTQFPALCPIPAAESLAQCTEETTPVPTTPVRNWSSNTKSALGAYAMLVNRGEIPATSISKNDLIDIEELASDTIDSFRNFQPWLEEEFTLPLVVEGPRVEGSNFLRAEISRLINEYAEIFSAELGLEPADLPAMELVIDDAKWEVPSNRGAFRTQSVAKEAEIEVQTSKLLATHRIITSTEPYYSQVHLAPKPNTNPVVYRTCIDYRRLNEVTAPISWPLPMIEEMLRRIGSKKPKVFGTIDLTSGYHQIAMGERSRRYTAFTTYLGVFEWLCVPFGLKGAPAFFQMLLSTIVLAGIIYSFVELYIDDIIIHAQTEEEFIGRLRVIFERCRKYRLILSPKKCVFGVSQVEYVGRVINEHGISFSHKKREFVVNFVRPETQKQMKSFVGLVNHFSSHLRDCSHILRPLREMSEPFIPKQRLLWTEALITAYQAVRDAFNDLPTMYFINSTWKVYLHTDASDYGVGAYLFQLDTQGTEYPIAFLSRSFSDRERRWGTPQKEAYGIFFALSKLEYLLRDIHFTLFTDHENLVYMNRCDAGIIKRWKLAIQEYSFDILHIKGVNNFIVDAFSRMIPILEGPGDDYLMMADEFKIPSKEFKIISSVHNTICGHMGVELTLKRLHALGHNWHSMREHVRRFIRMHCPCCQKMSFLKVPIMANHFTASTYSPWER